MATMYVNNIATNETVNLRKTPSRTGTVLVRVGYGKAVDAYASTTEGWHHASYNGYEGYIMSEFLTTNNPNNSSSSNGEYIGEGTVVGGRLYCRKQPQAGYAYWGQFNSGDIIPLYSCQTGWYETRWPATGNNIGYVMSDYISVNGSNDNGDQTNYNIPLTVETDRYGTGTSLSLRKSKSTGSTELCKIPVGKTVMVSTKSGEWLPAQYDGKTGYVMAKFISGSDVYCADISGVTGKSKYERDIAVAYARQYSSNSSGTDSYNNAQYKPVGDSPTNINKDCANFVSQCLFAGGMPMHDDWHYYYPGNVSNPNVNAAWKGTNSQKKSIASRKWGERVYDISKLKKGDLVYSYDTNLDNGTFGHVVIIAEDVGNSATMTVCGHTQNQRNADRAPKSKDAYFHIYDYLPVKDTDYFG